MKLKQSMLLEIFDNLFQIDMSLWIILNKKLLNIQKNSNIQTHTEHALIQIALKIEAMKY